MNNLDPAYQSLLQHILDNGVKKQTRNGETLSVFGYQIRHDMSEGFPLLTTKKMAWKQIVTELMWFLRGDTNIKYLVDNDCHIWDGDAYKNYLKWFDDTSKKLGVIREPWSKEQYIEQIKLGNVDRDLSDLGPIYGRQWRAWLLPLELRIVDQIANLISELKTNPDSRRLMVSAWNVGELDQMVLPPCHYGFQVYTRPSTRDEEIINPGKYHRISLMWNQRSVDTFLGLPFNIASYGLLLHILAELTDMIPDQLVGNLGDVHLYANHLDQAREQISRKPFNLPTLSTYTEFWPTESGECGIGPFTSNLDSLINQMLIEDFQIENYQYHPTIKAPLSN